MAINTTKNFRATVFCKSVAYLIIYVFMVQSCVWMMPLNTTSSNININPVGNAQNIFTGLIDAFHDACNLFMPSKAYAASSTQDILVNDKSTETEGIASHGSPSVAMDWQGNFVTVWTDNRNNQYDIWVQRFDSDSNPLGGNQKVNDDLGTDDQGSSQVAMNKDGDFVVVWYDDREGNYNIYAQKFNSLGNRIGPNYKINDDTGVAKQVSPSIGMDSTGNFVVTWIDGRDGGQDIYVQRFDSSGTPM